MSVSPARLTRPPGKPLRPGRHNFKHIDPVPLKSIPLLISIPLLLKRSRSSLSDPAPHFPESTQNIKRLIWGDKFAKIGQNVAPPGATCWQILVTLSPQIRAFVKGLLFRKNRVKSEKVTFQGHIPLSLSP